MKKKILPYIASLTKFLKESGLEITPLPKVVLSSDNSYVEDPFGKTAYYSPEEKMIVLFIKGRHIKDILRSFSHEMIHHHQNMQGRLAPEDIQATQDPKYMQNNQSLMEIEKEAFLDGNLLFRKWTEDNK